MAKAQKLPSGTWRVRVYDKTTKKRLSFTGRTASEAEYAALEWKYAKQRKEACGLIIGEAAPSIQRPRTRMG